MKELISFPVCEQYLEEYGGGEGLAQACAGLGCSGIEAIWCGDGPMAALPEGLAVGYHMLFYADWVDFWNGDQAALEWKFGNRAAWTSFYSCDGREGLLSQYQADLERAAVVGCAYPCTTGTGSQDATCSVINLKTVYSAGFLFWHS